jgi:hypothetical protein
MTAIVVVTTCCSSAAAAALRGGSPIAAAVPPVTLGALNERLLVGTAASDLRALASTRGGTIGTALSTRRQECELQPFETRAFGEATTYLKVEKPRFLFLEGSPDAMAVTGVAATALPDSSAARAGASTTRATPSVERLVAGASALAQALAPLPPPWLSVRGRRLPPLRGGCPPSLSSSSSSPDDEYSEVVGGESPCCSRSRNSSSLCSRRSRRRILRFLRVARSCSRRCAARALGLGVWAGRTARRSRSPSAGKSEMSEPRWRVAEE